MTDDAMHAANLDLARRAVQFQRWLDAEGFGPPRYTRDELEQLVAWQKEKLQAQDKANAELRAEIALLRQGIPRFGG